MSDFRANHEREMERFLSHQQWKSTMKKEELRKKLRVHMNRHHLMTHVLKLIHTNTTVVLIEVNQESSYCETYKFKI